ncbi:MAG: YfbM family protein [Bryobacterales bacterium]|nr:YfbM family protein [Bryobacterales bacterium]
MSMSGKLRRIPAHELERVRTDERFREGMLATGTPEFDLSASLSILRWYVRWPMRILLRKQIRAARQAEAAAREGRAVLDLHKSWHGIHWLLCQSAWEGPEPYRSVILGGQEIGEDLGYGPPRLMEPAQVAEVAHALGALSAAQVMKRYDGVVMDREKVYPGAFTSDSEWRKVLEQDFERLQRFYRETVRERSGLLSWLE